MLMRKGWEFNIKNATVGVSAEARLNLVEDTAAGALRPMQSVVFEAPARRSDGEFVGAQRGRGISKGAPSTLCLGHSSG
jgi:hypothetical protein